MRTGAGELLVLDASVAAKWILPPGSEPFAEQALWLLRQYETGELRFVVPDSFWAEIGNVLWKVVQQGRLPAANAYRAVAELRNQKLPTVPASLLLEEALAIAIAFRRSVYDSLYVALALQSKAHLVTADERLANALAARFPVKWLGSAW